MKNKMNEKHYREKLSAFVDHELPGDERQAIGEHLLLCAVCRAEHDEIKLGAALANKLERAGAPENLWNKIENALDEKEKSRISAISAFPFFGSRGSAAAGLLIMFGLAAAVYFGLSKNETLKIVENSPETISIQANETKIAQADAVSWNVETISGTPKVEDFLGMKKISVGQFLETDANSRARVQIADIGQVEVAPNSRVKMVGTKSTEHRLSLERGVLQAKIFAPPRLFIVDTPSAVVVDLGCEYTLEVDAAGNSRLHVKSGFVALERGGRESIVPAGAVCLTKKGKGLGTPFSGSAPAEFQKAVHRFDFENGGIVSLETIIKNSSNRDALTLWHLLPRTQKAERERVFDALISFVKLPKGATREGVLRLDKKMLEDWWLEIENLWFE